MSAAEGGAGNASAEEPGERRRAHGERPPGEPLLPLARYPMDALYQEMAYIAYHFHWPLGELLELEHAERHRWVEQISKINRRLTSGNDD